MLWISTKHRNSPPWKKIEYHVAIYETLFAFQASGMVSGQHSYNQQGKKTAAIIAEEKCICDRLNIIELEVKTEKCTLNQTSQLFCQFNNKGETEL